MGSADDPEDLLENSIQKLVIFQLEKNRTTDGRVALRFPYPKPAPRRNWNPRSVRAHGEGEGEGEGQVATVDGARFGFRLGS